MELFGTIEGLLGLLASLVVFYDVRDAWALRRLQRARAAVASSAAKTAAASGTPRVDIVIPIYNMGATFERTLRSIEHAAYPKQRVIVVDDGSDDGMTAATLQRLAPRIDCLARIAHGGKSAAANHGADLGDGDIILFLDADSYVTADFIQATIDELGGGYDAVDFVQQVANPSDSLWTRLAAFEREILTLTPDNFGALFAMRRNTFETHRFEDCLSPQFEINHRLMRNGRLKISARKVVYSDEPATLKRVYRRKRRWVYGLLEGCRIHHLPFDYHIFLPFADILLLALIVFAWFEPRVAIFPCIVWLAWTAKSLYIARLLGLGLGAAIRYPLYMTVLSVAVVEATIRYKLGKKVAWR